MSAAETMTATVITPTQHQQLGGSLEDGIRNAFMLVPTQQRRMELLDKLFRADEQLTANEEAQSCRN